MTDYYVVKLVNDFELIVNMGTDSGIAKGTILEVLDADTLDVRDPKTGKNLGSIDRPKARIAVEVVGEQMSLCRVLGRAPGGISAVARVLAGEPPSLLASALPSWPENVRPEDPVQRTGKRLKSDAPRQ